MRSDDKPLAEILHKNQEENLSAAKKSLKQHRKAYIHRRTDLGGDVIDIIDDGEIIEQINALCNAIKVDIVKTDNKAAHARVNKPHSHSRN